jgi:hypothetical protein
VMRLGVGDRDVVGLLMERGSRNDAGATSGSGCLVLTKVCELLFDSEALGHVREGIFERGVDFCDLSLEAGVLGGDSVVLCHFTFEGIDALVQSIDDDFGLIFVGFELVLVVCGVGELAGD